MPASVTNFNAAEKPKVKDIYSAMTHPLRRVITIFICLLSLTALSACVTGGGYGTTPRGSQTDSAPSSVQSQNAGITRVGILLPLSGQNKALGEAMLKAAQMAMFDLGYQNFELIPRDTKGTPMGADAATRSAIQSGAQLILGPVFASEVRAAKPIAASANINLIAFSTDWTLAGGNTYIMGFLPFDQVERLTSFAANQNIDQIGVLSPDDEYGRTVTRAFTDAARKTNIKITNTASFAPNGVNMIPIVNQFAANPNLGKAVFMPVGGQQAGLLAGQLRAAGLSPQTLKRLGTGLFDDATLARDPNLNGAWFAAPSPAMRARFEQRYQSTYGAPAPRLTTLAYDASALAVILAKRGNEQSGRPAFTRSALTDPNGFAGIDGIFRFKNNGVAERGLAILEFQGGQIKVIDEAPKTFQTLTQ